MAFKGALRVRYVVAREVGVVRAGKVQRLPLILVQSALPHQEWGEGLERSLRASLINKVAGNHKVGKVERWPQISSRPRHKRLEEGKIKCCILE
jgi:hypothetical protein